MLAQTNSIPGSNLVQWKLPTTTNLYPLIYDRFRGSTSKFGALARDRTPDRRVTNALLYRLSYTGNNGAGVQSEPARFKLFATVVRYPKTVGPSAEPREITASPYQNVNPVQVSITFQHQKSPAFSTSDPSTVSSLRTLCEDFRGDISAEYFTPVEVLRGWLVEVGRPLWADALAKRGDDDMVTVVFSP